MSHEVFGVMTALHREKCALSRVQQFYLTNIIGNFSLTHPTKLRDILKKLGWRKKAGIICKIFIFYWGTSNNESEGRDSSGSTDSSDSIYFSTVILDKWMGSLIKLNMVAPLITDPPHSNPTSCKIKLFDKDSWGRASVTWKLLVEQHRQHFFRHFSFFLLQCKLYFLHYVQGL